MRDFQLLLQTALKLAIYSSLLSSEVGFQGRYFVKVLRVPKKICKLYSNAISVSHLQYM